MMKLIISIVLFWASAAWSQIVLTPKNNVNLRGEINEKSSDSVVRKVLELDRKRGVLSYPIYITIESPGGSIPDGESLIEALKGVKNLKTISIFAASMASAIVEALPGERLILESGSLMFHRARGSVGGQFETGELESRLSFYQKTVRKMEQRSANRLNISLNDYKQRVINEWWTTAEEAVAQKQVDKIVTIKCSPELLDSTSIISIDMFLFSIDLEVSDCPLLKSVKPVGGQNSETIKAFKDSNFSFRKGNVNVQNNKR